MSISQDQLLIQVPLKLDEGVNLPSYMSEEAAGADVQAFLSSPITLQPGSSTLVPTGIRLEIPKGYEIQVRPRSGLAFKHQVTVLNSPGTIDSDYRGELRILLINHGKEPFMITNGMRIAQLVLSPVVKGHFITSDFLNQTVRHEGGFGHTGIHG